VDSNKCVVSPRMVRLLILLTAVLIFLPVMAGAQVFLYGRADFPTGSNYLGSVVVADFNGDGRPDLAVTNSQSTQISILLGSADGGFVAGGTYATGANPTALVAADFNHDKKIDLAVVNANAGTISVFLGNGDGSFQNRVDYAVGEGAAAIVAADFDGDGTIDLATISTNDSAIAVLLGKGDGSFEVEGLIPVPSGPTLLVGGDVNKDGKVDLITCNNNYSTGTITVLLSNGDGTFKQVESQAPSFATAVGVADFNRDGKLDMVIVADYSLYLSLGNGDGTFQNPVAITNAPQNQYNASIVVGDLNHDGKPDIVLSGVWAMLGNGDGTFQNPILSVAEATPMVIADINGDGEADVVAITSSGSAPVLLGNGSGSFMDVRTIALATSSDSTNVGLAADFNGDGKLDLAVAEQNYPNGQVSVELGKGNGTFSQPIVSALTSDATSTTLMLAADFNGDGKSDLLVEDNNGDGFQVLLGRGNGSFETPVDTPLSYSLLSFATGDFNKDGKADLVVTTNSNSSAINIYLSNGDGTFSPGMSYVVYPSSYVAVADVNGDGNLDLIVVATGYGYGSNLLVFLGNGDGTFKNPLFGPSDAYYSSPVIGDFNGDGKLDVVVGTSSHGIAFMAGNGDGTFQTQVYSDATLQLSGPLFTADFNGDSKLDLAARSNYYYSGALIMSGNGDGTFGPPTGYDSSANGYGGPGFAGDFNSDGVSDLAIPGQTSSNAPAVFLYLSTPTPHLRPTALNFGSEQVGKTSSPKKVSLTNDGNSKLNISSITVSGDFLEKNNCGKGLAVGKSCTIQVSFKPTQKGIRTGQVTIADNAPGRMQKIDLEGTGK
jgi:FG-GAP-like repeat/HYDIN/CFA65/VesB-like, Ig-like domain/FG-GAP repeat